MSAADNYFHELQERIKKHPGKKVFDALRAYDMSKFILDGNASQLRQLICLLEDPKDPAQIMGMERREHLQWLFNDCNRHIHNFLTSITTLIDHTRNLMKADFITLQDEFEGTNPKGPRALLMRIGKESPDFKNAKTPWGGSYDELLNMTDNGRSGDVGRRVLLVNCWFIGKTETQKMWNDYGDGGKGIAIRSTVKRLATSFQISEPVGSFVGRVNYVDFETHDLGPRGEDQALVPFLKDKNKFADENEARIVTLNNFHQGTLLPDGSQPVCAGFAHEIQGLYIKCSLQELIQSIVVGPNTDWNFHMLMKRLVARFGLTINVEHSKLSPFK